MKSNANVYDAWFNMMSSITDTWKNFTGNLNGEKQESKQEFSDFTAKWFQSYQETTAKLFEPVLHQTQQVFLNWFYMNFVNPAFYRNAMDQSMAGHKTFDQVSSKRYAFTEDLINAGRTYFSAFEKYVPSMDNLTKIYPHTISGWYTDIFKASQRNLFPFLSSVPDVKAIDWQYNLKTAEYLIRYYNKSTRMQYLITSTALCAWEKLIKEIHSEAKEGKPVSNFNEFYTIWSELNEKEFENLLHTKEFVMLQEELVRIKSELVKRFEKQSELLMQPFPVVSKSQIEEVYETNHDLRKRIAKLEKEMAN